MDDSGDGLVRATVPDGLFPDQEAGTPWLPEVVVRVMIPPNSEVVDVSVNWSDILLAEHVRPIPAQEPVPLSATSAVVTGVDEARYISQPLWPASRYEVAPLETMRGFTMQPVVLRPFSWRTGDGSLFLATNMTIQVRYRAAAGIDDMASTQVASPHFIFDQLARQMVLNPDEANGYQMMATDEEPLAGCDYLVITSSALSNSFERLAAYHRTNDNVTARVITTSWIDSSYSGTKPSGGSDQQTRIRNAIIDFVDNQGTTYVVLGGDNTVVPDRDTKVSCGGSVESSMPTDLYYSGLDGTWDSDADGVYGEAGEDDADLAYDVMLGRIPVRTAAQADAYIGKVMTYREDRVSKSFMNSWFIAGDKLWNTFSGTSRPSDTVNDGLAGFRSHDPVSDAEQWTRRLWRDVVQVHKTNLYPTAFFDTITSWDGSAAGDYSQNSANMVSRLNEGCNQMFMATHGGTTVWGLESGGFYETAAALLTNTTAFVYTMACLTGGFDAGEPSLSEAFVRNGHGGALAYMGCSRYGWGSPGTYVGGTSIAYAQKYYKLVFTNSVRTIGSIFAAHKALLSGYCAYNGAYRWVQFGLNLQGDPLVTVLDSDVVPGADTFRFAAFALSNRVVLRWSQPTKCGHFTDQVRITYAADDYPSDSDAGSVVYEGTNTTTIHTGLTNDRSYYYSIWASDDGSTFIEP